MTGVQTCALPISIGSILYVNVYLPSIKCEADKEVFTDTLASIEEVLSKFKGHSIIWGGELNLNLLNINNKNKNDWPAIMFRKVMLQYCADVSLSAD